MFCGFTSKQTTSIAGRCLIYSGSVETTFIIIIILFIIIIFHLVFMEPSPNVCVFPLAWPNPTLVCLAGLFIFQSNWPRVQPTRAATNNYFCCRLIYRLFFRLVTIKLQPSHLQSTTVRTPRGRRPLLRSTGRVHHSPSRSSGSSQEVKCPQRETLLQELVDQRVIPNTPSSSRLLGAQSRQRGGEIHLERLLGRMSRTSDLWTPPGW